MPIKCGKGHQHETVAEVRACYGVSDTAILNYRQNKYPGTCVKCGGKVEPLTGRLDKTEFGWQTSHLDGRCRVMPAKVSVDAKIANDRYAAIPVGHYATKSLTGNNDLDFWRVDRPEQGTYAGRTFVKRIVGGKPDLNVSRETKFSALEAILETGVETAALLYGTELGRCHRCNRTLTDQTSRELGIGPECRSKGR